MLDLIKELRTDFFKVESFDDPGYSGDMLKPARLIFPLVEFLADGFLLFGSQRYFSIFREEIWEMFQEEAFLVEIVLLFYQFDDLSDLSGKQLVIVIAFDG